MGQRILEHISNIQFNERTDVHRWKIEENGKMISSKMWNTIREKEQIVDWVDLVWSSKVIPILRHQFILWLAFKEMLNTRDRVKKYMEILVTSCLLYEGNEETTDHVFGCFPFASNL
ncbi:uncharacterized protein LOC124935136 [Impatiens glandulifera]|uniref:uncharacterized protein LOC124935136 n=1 Tax=Impatiens glandulifera TaxID=253017 RepID=UPI001FB0F903|nr:uncharacterized protein LOC124935136 [Impatiens glandulifera]